MFCNRCGGALNAGAQFCPACGERIVPGPQAAQPAPSARMAFAPYGRVRRHVGVLAALWMLNGILRLLEVFSFTILGNLLFHGTFMGNHWDLLSFPFRWATWPFSLGLTWIAVLLGVFGVIHLILAWGLYERKLWARPLGLVIGFLALIRFPLGTALGIYTIWVLLPELSAREYEQIAVP